MMTGWTETCFWEFFLSLGSCWTFLYSWKCRQILTWRSQILSVNQTTCLGLEGQEGLTSVCVCCVCARACARTCTQVHRISSWNKGESCGLSSQHSYFCLPCFLFPSEGEYSSPNTGRTFRCVHDIPGHLPSITCKSWNTGLIWKLYCLPQNY